MVKRRWQLSALIAFVAAMGAVVVLAQACGGSAGVDVTLPTSAAGSETPVPRERFPPGDMHDNTPGAGPPGQGLEDLVLPAAEALAGACCRNDDRYLRHSWALPRDPTMRPPGPQRGRAAQPSGLEGSAASAL